MRKAPYICLNAIGGAFPFVSCTLRNDEKSAPRHAPSGQGIPPIDAAQHFALGRDLSVVRKEIDESDA